jgi:hypothetical protein
MLSRVFRWIFTGVSKRHTASTVRPMTALFMEIVNTSETSVSFYQPTRPNTFLKTATFISVAVRI